MTGNRDCKMLSITILYLLLVIALPLGLSLAMGYRGLPHGRACPLCGGETLRLQDTVVRLQGVAAPPRGLSCHAGDGSVNDCGAAAAAALATLVRGRQVACRLHGRDTAGLAQGVCEAAGTELNRAVVLAGWARALDASGMNRAEAEARGARRGLWRDGSMPAF